MSCAVITDVVHRPSAFLALLGLLSLCQGVFYVVLSYIFMTYIPRDPLFILGLNATPLWLSLQKSASRMPDLEVTTKDDISWKRRFWKNSGRLVEGISMMTNILRSFNQPIQTKKNDIIYTYLHVWVISKGHCRYKVIIFMYILNIVD